MCVWGAGNRRLCLSVLCIAERQVADCPLVLADCVLDEACGFLTVSTAGSEVSCDFYAWASDNIACTTSDPVSRGSRVEVLSCVCPTSDMPSLNRHHSEQRREWDYQQVVPHFLHFFKMMGFWEIETGGDWWWLRMKLTQGLFIWAASFPDRFIKRGLQWWAPCLCPPPPSHWATWVTGHTRAPNTIWVPDSSILSHCRSKIWL